MSANPFATELCLAVDPLPIPAELRRDLEERHMTYWEYVFESVRARMYQLEMDLDDVTIEIDTEDDAEQQRFMTIAGIRNDEAFSVRALVGEFCVVVDDDYEPLSDTSDDPEDTWGYGNNGGDDQ
ncbi:MAG: hypothetical protein PHE68_04515 [Candidatus Peribacteraceae bacterium]|nr:hypothetical protein [Candidatus Peribacteraceae bacterium]MDD5074553.1 hypothetical protein [Candidatus Peribacteraceae bacterium]